MMTRPFLLHALSPLHAGTGHASDIIDLPTARMKATGIPFLPGSSIKGVLREARRAEAEMDGQKKPQVQAVFGPSDDSSAHAGALAVGDARLLALPVRSFKGTFAWVSSPLLLVLAQRDLERKLPIPTFSGREARVGANSVCVHNNYLYLEDLDLPVQTSAELDDWTKLLAPLASPGEDIFSRRFAVIDDDTMAFLWETATQVDVRIRLDEKTRTVADGAMWLEESLPPETLLLGIATADKSRREKVEMKPKEVLDYALPKEKELVLQFGGKATTGHGRCRMIPIQTEGGVDHV